MANISYSKWFAASAIAAVIVSGCTTREPHLDLLDSKPKTSSGDSNEQERLKQLELIKLVPVDASGKSLDPVTIDANTLYYVFENTCYYPWWDLQDPGNSLQYLMYGQKPLCIAHQMLAAIQPSGGLRLTNDSEHHLPPNPNAVAWILGPQSAETNVALARVAKKRAQVSLSNFDTGLTYSIASAYPSVELDLVNTDPIVQAVTGTQTVRESLSNYFVEAFNVLEEATQKEVDGMVAYGDFQRANPSLTQGVDQGVLGADLSRAGAVHALVGGGAGLQLAMAAGVTPAPFRPVCSRPNLSPGGRQALELMRQAALRPSDVMTLSLDNLVNGSSTGCTTTSCGSIKQRLVLFGKDTSAESSVDVQVRFGLTIGDFAEARDYLREEFAAYRRYPGQIDPTSADAFPKFGGTATTPLVPDKAFYRALSTGTPVDAAHALDENYVDWSTYDYSSPTNTRLIFDDTLSFVDELDITLSHVQAVLASPTATASGSSAGYRPLVAFAGEGYRRRLGRMTLNVFTHASCSAAALGCVSMTYHLAGVPLGQGYRVAFGDQAMECMTKGSLDGYTCSLAAYTISTPNVTATTSFGSTGFTSVTSENRDFAVTTNPALNTLFPGERVYLLRPRTPQSNDTAAPPGGYEAIGAGVVPNIPPAYTSRYGVFPLVPDLDQKVRDLLAPSTAWCTQQEVSCSGGHFDERLPLENELTQDGTTSESSWKHYLDLAKSAATEADSIGSEMIQHEIDLTANTENQAETQRDRDEAQRIQVEQTLEELQSICGTSVDPRTLLAGFSSDPKNNNLDQEPTITCSSDANCTAARDSRCYSGRCILDPVKVAQNLLAMPPGTPSSLVSAGDAQRLVNCIGDDTVVDFATIGTQPVCVWFPPPGTGTNSYCSIKPDANNDKSAICPAPARVVAGNGPGAGDTYDCSGMTLPASGYTTKPVSETLGFFDNADTGQPDPGPVGAQCRALAYVRAFNSGYHYSLDAPFPSAADGVPTVIASNRLHIDSLKLLAPSLGWQPTIGGFSSITFNGEAIYSTGGGGVPATSGWPCDPATRTGPEHTLFGPTPISPYFPTGATCTNENYRAYINQRMRDAVMAAQATTNNSFANVSIPSEINPAFYGQRLSSSAFGIAPGTGTLPLFLDQYPEGTIGSRTHPPLSIYRATGPWSFWEFPGGDYLTALTDAFYPRTGQYYFYWWNLGTQYKAPDVFAGFVPEMIWYGAGQDGHALVDRIPSTHGQSDPRGVFLQMLQGKESGSSFDRDTGDSRGFGVNPENLWDAAELMCVSSAVSATPAGSVTTGEDISKAASYLEQTADYLVAQAGRRVFANFPKFAEDAVRKQGANGAYPALGGQIADEVSQLRSNLIDLAGIAPKVASQLRLFAGDLRTFRALLQRNGLERDLNSLQYTSDVANNLTECAKSVLDALSAETFLDWGSGGKAAATCANSLFQNSIAERVKDTKNAISSVDDQIQFANFSTTFENRSQALKDLSDQALKLTEESDGHLAEIERMRGSARRALDHAIVMDSFSNQVHYHSNDVMRSRLNTDAARYGQRLEDAKRLAFVAKRAIEQRIGIHLSEMTYNMPLVDAPANWEAQLCTLQGIDYTAIDKASSSSDPAANTFSYASGYIGDYVDKLEKVVESYVLSSNFHEGHDTAVISLKDDVVKASKSCEAPSRNLLAYTSDLSHLSSDSLTDPGWEIVGCATQVVDSVPTPRAECVSVMSDPSQLLRVEGNSVPGFLVRRGPRCTNSAGVAAFSCGEAGTTVPTCPSGGCGLSATARLRQRVSLGAGKYRISYYTKAKTTAVGAELFGIGGLRVVTDPDGTGTGATLADDFRSSYSATDVEVLSGYKRVFADFTLASPQVVSVEIGADRLSQLNHQTTVINDFQTQTLTGVMLENITRYTQSANTRIDSPFASTDETLTSVDTNCPDTDGSAFRKKAWVRNCLSLCNGGYGDTCSESGLSRECFWELNFPLSQRLIESGRQLSSAGFAKGNFNYRIQNVALNFVGTGVRDCTGQPESCNGAGFIQYSLSHQGPFFVRNHFGGTFEAKLFDGNIEHARGLGTERYITNPVSSSDNSLLQSYMHSELNGRPMDGNFVLRIWESPDLDLSKITDVQVVMEYGYWTRFN